MLKVKAIDKVESLFTSNSFIFCDKCFFYKKYELLSNYDTLSCDCNSLGIGGFWIQHNKSRLGSNITVISKGNKNKCDIEVRTLNKGKITFILKKQINKKIESFLEELNKKNKEWIKNNTKNIEEDNIKNYNYFLENKKRIKKKIEKGVTKNIIFIEKKYGSKLLLEKEHIILGDIHNRVEYVEAVFQIAKNII